MNPDVKVPPSGGLGVAWDDQFNETHVYGRAGTFRVTLIVWDDQGRGAIKERVVTVGEASDNHRGPSSGSSH